MSTLQTTATARVQSLPRLSLQSHYLCLFVLTLTAAAFRIYHLSAQGLNLDEGFSAYLGRTKFADFLGNVWNSEFNMVLYYALLRGWMHLGRSEFAIRLLSVVIAVLTIPAMYYLAERLFRSGWTALVSSLLLTVHPFHLMLSQDARSYTLVIWLVTLASLFFVRTLQNPSWGNTFVYALFCAAAVYSHFFALLVILSHAISLFWYPGKLPLNRIFFAVILLAVLLLPFAIFMVRHSSIGHISWVAPLHCQQVLELLCSLTLSKWRSLTYVIAWTLALFTALFASPKEAWPYRFTATWLFAPLLATFLVSIWRPLLVERFLAVCIPACVLLVGAGVAIIARRSRAAALVLLAVTIFYSMSNIRHYFRHPEYGENWREASAYLLSRAQPGDAVVLLPGLGPATFDYYRERYPRKVTGLLLADSAAAALPDSAPQNVWFIGSVLLTPNWATEADAFAQAHQALYCEEPPQPDSGSVRVWQFRLCSAEGARSR